jgi:hypothetical protein
VRALADDHGEGEQGDLVDKVVVEQPPDQGAAAVHLQLTSRLSSLTAAATSLERTVVLAHRGSVSVVDATYFGREFNAAAMGLMPGSATAPGSRQRSRKSAGQEECIGAPVDLV